MSDVAKQRAWGRIGGLTAHSRHGADVMLAGARAGFRERFRRDVLAHAAGEPLTPEEIELRVDRAIRAYMLALAQRSAEARARKGAA